MGRGSYRGRVDTPGSSLPMPMADQRTMLRNIACVSVLFTMLAGCLEVEQTIVLGADGSGRQSVKFAMSRDALADLQRVSGGAQLGTAQNPTAIFDKNAVAAELRTAGMELVRHKATDAGGKRTVDLEATFADFAALGKSPLCGSNAEWVLVAGPREGTAKLTLYPQGKAAWDDARAKAEAMHGAVDAVAQDFFLKKQKALEGLDVTLRFQLPGDVLVWTRNLEKTGDREVTARITGAQIKTPEDLVRRLAPRFEVIFDAKDCKLPLN